MCNERGVVVDDALGSELPLFGVKEPRRTWPLRKPEPCDNGDQDCQSPLNYKQVLPVVQCSTTEVKDAVRWITQLA